MRNARPAQGIHQQHQCLSVEFCGYVCKQRGNKCVCVYSMKTNCNYFCMPLLDMKAQTCPLTLRCTFRDTCTLLRLTCEPLPNELFVRCSAALRCSVSVSHLVCAVPVANGSRAVLGNRLTALRTSLWQQMQQHKRGSAQPYLLDIFGLVYRNG